MIGKRLTHADVSLCLVKIRMKVLLAYVRALDYEVESLFHFVCIIVIEI